MPVQLTWNKPLFSNSYQLFTDGHPAGELRDKAFSSTTHAALDGRRFAYHTTGVFTKKTEIIDESSGQKLGQITYGNWMTKAEITLGDRVYAWKYLNPWNTRWRLSGPEGEQLDYAGGSLNGRIEANTADPLLLLTGLYITNYYWQLGVAIAVAVLIPAWTVLS